MTRYGKHGKPKQPQILLQILSIGSNKDLSGHPGCYVQGFEPDPVKDLKDVRIRFTIDPRMAWTMAKAEDAHALRGMLMFVFGCETRVLCRHLRKTPNDSQPPFPILHP